jgi:hypothetical protein
MNGERPYWPAAPSQGHDVSTSVKELCESCWNADSSQRPTAQAIIEALALVIIQTVILPQVLQALPITSNVDVYAL